MKYIVTFFICLFYVSSCRENTIEYHMKKLYQAEITIPQFDDWIFYGHDSTWMKYLQPQLKLIIYFDSTICTTCKLSQIWDWKKVVDYAKKKDYQFQPVFIVSPPKRMFSEIDVSLKKYPFEWPIFIDHEREFYKLNPFLPKESFFHIFLLDKNDKIILVGDPLLKEELWKLYQKKIDTILKD